jgi:acyl-CoA thioester hydrolase
VNIPADGWYRLDVPVRFRDVDAMGHAHHTLPLIYLEEARAAFWRELKRSALIDEGSPLGDEGSAVVDEGSPVVDDIDYVMAEVTLRFRARILYPSAVSVLLGVSDVGRKSFTTSFEIRDAAGAVLSSGSAVQVAYDYAAGRAKPIEEADRAVLNAWRAALQNSSAIPADTDPITAPST